MPGRQKEHPAWDFYCNFTEHSKYATCILCHKVVSVNGTSTDAMFHLTAEHADVYEDELVPQLEDYKRKRRKALDDAERRLASAKEQCDITDFMKPKKGYPINSPEKKKRDKALVYMIVEQFLPINIVNGEGLRFFASVLDPKYTMCTPRTVYKRLEAMRSLISDYINKRISES